MTAADIPQNTLFMMSEPTRFFIQNWLKLGLGGEVKKYFSLFEGDFTRMCYLRREFDAEAEYLTHKMIERPVWALRWIDRVERWSRLFMERSVVLARAPHEKLTDRQLIRLFEWCLKYHRLSHGVGGSISWHADAEKERVTKAIWRSIEEHLRRVGSDKSVPEIFSVLTTPSEESFVSKEEREFLTLAVMISGRPKTRAVFLRKKVDRIADTLRRVDSAVSRLILSHYRKYRWLAFQYKGPASPLEEYLGRWQQLIRSKIKPAVLLRKVIGERRRLLAEQRQLIRDLRFPTNLRQLITLGQRLVFIKDFRKDALYHGMYCYEPLFREIGRRLGLTLNQMWAMNSWEIAPALLKNRFDPDELNARQVFAVAYAEPRRYVVYTGKRARRFLAGVRFEKLHVGRVKSLSGTPACPGKVTGIVKIINVPEEMGKMKKGDIMVAHNTNPNLIPAMRKAAALVSEAGGLTCHTAIVARELRTPCVVGVLGATRVLKDGDRVEVDATQGIVRKLHG